MKRAIFILTALLCACGLTACKKEFTRLDTDTYSVSIPGKPHQSYVEFPLEALNTKLSMTTYESNVGSSEYFSISSVDWEDAKSKVQESQGDSWNQDQFYSLMSDAFFTTMVSGGTAGGSPEETTIGGHKAYAYAITALTDPKTGESMLKEMGKGTLAVIPTEKTLFTITYYASVSNYDENRMKLFFDSFQPK